MRNQKVMRKNNEILTIGMDYVRENRSMQVMETKVLRYLTNE